MVENFSLWWENLEIIEKIYWSITIPFSLFFVLQLVLTFFSGDISEDMGADMDVESDNGISFQFFTLKNLVAFFTIFGWTGIACLDSGLSDGLSIILATLAGFVMMLLMASIFYFMSKAVESGTLNLKNAIGNIGEVYLEVKSQRENVGKVQINIQGTLRTLDAITDDKSDLQQGTVVEVKSIANNLLIVSKSVSS